MIQQQPSSFAKVVFFGVNAAVGALVGKLFGPAAGAVAGLGVSWLALDQQAKAASAGPDYAAPPWATPVALVTMPGALAVAGLQRAREVWDAPPRASVLAPVGQPGPGSYEVPGGPGNLPLEVLTRI